MDLPAENSDRTTVPEASGPPAVVILAGGAGTRFWPVSTGHRPKQFLRLVGERSLLQQSYDRAALLTDPERVVILTSADFVPLVREQLPELPARNVIGEPARRDTAAAVCLGALVCRRRFGDCVMVVLTADHVIAPDEEFARSVGSAARAAAVGERGLYTFGIAPTRAATGYGYLRLGPLLLDDGGVRHYRLGGFHEKPGPAVAAAYLADGGYLWNSGMFAWRVEVILEEFRRSLPLHLAGLAGAMEVEGTARWPEALAAAFASLPAVSVDVGILEKAADVRMVEATFSWSDVGGWSAVGDFLSADGAGNRHRGRLAVRDARHNIVFAEDADELVALLGVEDLVVVRAGRRTLVARRDQVEDVKRLVETLAETGDTDDL